MNLYEKGAFEVARISCRLHAHSEPYTTMLCPLGQLTRQRGRDVDRMEQRGILFVLLQLCSVFGLCHVRLRATHSYREDFRWR